MQINNADFPRFFFIPRNQEILGIDKYETIGADVFILVVV